MIFEDSKRAAWASYWTLRPHSDEQSMAAQHHNAPVSEADRGGWALRQHPRITHPSPFGMKPPTPPTAFAQDTTTRTVQELPRERPRPPPVCAAERQIQTAYGKGCPTSAKDGWGGAGETSLQGGRASTKDTPARFENKETPIKFQ